MYRLRWPSRPSCGTRSRLRSTTSTISSPSFVSVPIFEGITNTPDADLHSSLLSAADQHHAIKITIPSPTMLHFRGGRKAISEQAYPNLDDFFADLAQCYVQEVNALYAAGCRYLQLDDTK